MKYKSELIKEIVETGGHEKSSLHYESECIESWIEEAKGAYPKLCDYQSEWLNYISILDDTGGSEDPEPPIGVFPYVTLTDVTDATIDNVVPYAYKTAILKGQTLVNISTQKSSSTFTFQSAYNGATPNRQAMAVAPANGYTLTKPNTRYIVKFTVSNYINNYGDSIPMTILDYDIYSVVKTIQVDGNGDYCIIGITKETLGQNGRILIKSNGALFENNTETEVSLTISNIMVIEYQDGMENWDIPYFEGIQSVKLPVLTTTGKNLYSGYEVGLLNTSTGVVDATSTNACTTNFINIKGREKLKTKLPGRCAVLFYDANKELVQTGWHEYTNANPTISIPNGYDLHYMRIRIRPGAESEAFKKMTDVMVVDVSEDINSYEPYKSNILSTSEEVVLRGIGDVKDTLDCLTGEVTQRIGEIVLDGSDSFSYTFESTSNEMTTMVHVTIPNTNRTFKFYNDKLAEKYIYENTSTTEGIFSDWNGLYIRLLNSKLQSANVEGVKEYLQENPITVQYELVQESIKTVDLIITNQEDESLTKIKPIEGTMQLSTSSDTIQPLFSGEIPVEAITQNLASFIEE